MPSPETLVDLYLHLANASDRQQRPLQRDKFLALAAGVAGEAGLDTMAEAFRRAIVERNPNHMLARFPSMREAMQTEDVLQYTHSLLRSYPFERAEYLLDKFRTDGYDGDHEFRRMLDDDPGHAADGGSGSGSGRDAAPDNSGLFRRPDRSRSDRAEREERTERDRRERRGARGPGGPGNPGGTGERRRPPGDGLDELRRALRREKPVLGVARRTAHYPVVVALDPAAPRSSLYVRLGVVVFGLLVTFAAGFALGALLGLPFPRPGR